MALETIVFQQDPFGYGCTDMYNLGGGGTPCTIHGFGLQEENMQFHHQQSLKRKSDSAGFDSSSNLEYFSSPSPMEQPVKDLDSNSSSSQEKCPAGVAVAATTGRRKRRRSTRAVKNQDEVEHQRMAHITVERKRRKQMNDYLSVLRSMMPPSYVQRGDQASIVGGAINFVKELEQMLQSLEANKRIKTQYSSDSNMKFNNTSHHDLFSDFFSFPQYSTRFANQSHNDQSLKPAEKRSAAIADIEVTMTESHANLKILSRKHPKQLLKIVAGLYSLHLNVLHLNVTTIDDMVLYCLSVKIEDECEMTSVNEIAAAVYDRLARIQEEAFC